MALARAALLLVVLAFASLSVAPTAAADPTVCGPWSGNQAIKSRTCIDPEGAPSCPVYTQYFTGLHYGVICYGVPPPGDVDPEDPLGVVPDVWPRCATPSTYGVQAWICVDPGNEECTLSRQTYLLGEYSPEECTADPMDAAELGPLPPLPLP